MKNKTQRQNLRVALTKLHREAEACIACTSLDTSPSERFAFQQDLPKRGRCKYTQNSHPELRMLCKLLRKAIHEKAGAPVVHHCNHVYSHAVHIVGLGLT